MKKVETAFRNQGSIFTLLMIVLVVLAGGTKSARASTVRQGLTFTLTLPTDADLRTPASRDRLNYGDSAAGAIPEGFLNVSSETNDSWGGSAGGFPYERSTPSTVPEPSAGSMLLVGLLLAGFAQFLRTQMVASLSPRHLSRRPRTFSQDRSRMTSPSCRL